MPTTENIEIPLKIDGSQAEKEVDKLGKKIDGLGGKDVDVNVEADTSKASAKVGSFAKDAGNEIEQEISKGFEKAGESSGSVFDGLKSSLGDVQGLISGAIGGGAFGLVTQGFGAVAGSIGEVFENANQLNSALLDIQAKTGLNTQEMEKFEEAAKTAFLGGVGESVAEAVGVLGQAQTLLGSTFEGEELGDFTAKAQALGNLFDKDVNEVIAKATPFIKQFGLSSDEAFNLLAKGLREGQTPSDDLLDTFAEYSQLASQAGFSAGQFTQILTSGAEEGIFNLDKLADSIKEAEIRLKAGDYTTAFQDIAKGANGVELELVKAIEAVADAGNAGELTIQETLQKSTKLINDAFTGGQISESLASQLQVAIAGTPAEDIGTELFGKIFSAPLDEATIQASAQRIGSEVSNAVGQYTEFDKFNRELSLFIQDTGKDIIDGLNTVLGFLAENFDKIATAIGVVTLGIGAYTLVTQGAAIAQGIAAAATTAWNAALALNPAIAIGLAVGALTVGVLALADALHDSTEEQLESNQAQIEQIEQQKQLNKQQQATEKTNQDLIASYEELGQKTDRTAEEQKKYEETQIALAKTYPGVIDSTKDFNENMNSLNQELANSKDRVKGLVEEYGNLQDQQKELAKQQLGLKIQLAEESAFEEFEGFLGLGGGDLKKKFNETKNKILKEWDSSGLQTLGTELQVDAFKDLEKLGASNEEINAFQNGLQEIIELQRQRIVANGGVIETTQKATEAVEENTIADKKNAEGKALSLEELIKQLAVLKIANKDTSDSYTNLFAKAQKLANEETTLKNVIEGLKIELGLAEDKGSGFATILEKLTNEQAKLKNELLEIDFQRQFKDLNKELTAYDETLKELKSQDPIELNSIFGFTNDDINKVFDNIGGFDLTSIFIEDDIQRVRDRANEITDIIQEQADKRAKITQDETDFQIERLEQRFDSEAKTRMQAFEKEIKDKGFTQEEIAKLQEQFDNNEIAIALNNKKTLENIENDGNEKITQIRKTALEEQKTIQDDAIEQEKKFRDQQIQTFNTLASATSELFTSLYEDLEEGSKNLAKLVLTTALDILDSLVPIWTAQIIGGSLATPQSIATAGGAGAIQAAILTGLLKAAVAVAKSQVGGLEEGGLVGTSHQKRGRTDTELRWLNPKEVVLSENAVNSIGLDKALYINKYGKLPNNNIFIDTRAISNVMQNELQKAKLVDTNITLNVKDNTGGRFTITRGAYR